MESYLYRQFPHHLQGLLACTSNTNAFPQPYSSADTTSGTRYHPYMYTSNYSRGHLSSNGSDPYGFGSCFQLTASVHSGTNKNQQTMSDDVFSRLSLSREDLSQYFASDISQLSTLKTLQDVCGLGVASTCFNNAAWLSGNATPKLTQTSVKQSTCSEINGGNVDHPFYNRRRRATSSEEGLTRTRDKYRVVYTDKQRKGLEKAYEENKFITMETRNKLSKELDLSDRQVTTTLHS
ncbi:hypothetical protein DPMN_112199 [Dreissena polymorpha]|uniref:Homeobox domain-containing protein n=1 Tax=Dreissena polymorpha TaxID=45954 RepID=A0A9D4QPP7_DREPO|nr:hypothetical protein DPMN_112199 [Dreissena polymorpha]